MPHNVDLIWRIFDELQQLAVVVGLKVTDGFDVREQIVIIGFQKFLIFVIKFVAKRNVKFNLKAKDGILVDRRLGTVEF